MQVSHLDEQKRVMIEAVKNHTPEVLVIDEITNEGEASTARTIANRGVTLIARYPPVLWSVFPHALALLQCSRQSSVATQELRT